MVFMTAVCKQHHLGDLRDIDILNMSVSGSQMFSRDGHVTLKASIGFRDYPSIYSVSSLHRVRCVLCIILYQAPGWLRSHFVSFSESVLSEVTARSLRKCLESPSDRVQGIFPRKARWRFFWVGVQIIPECKLQEGTLQFDDLTMRWAVEARSDPFGDVAWCFRSTLMLLPSAPGKRHQNGVGEKSWFLFIFIIFHIPCWFMLICYILLLCSTVRPRKSCHQSQLLVL